MERYVSNKAIVKLLTGRANSMSDADTATKAKKEILLQIINEVMNIEDCVYVGKVTT